MIASSRVLDRLPAEEPCLGAMFTTYSFDPAFFEDHVLRAVLRLSSDPVEQAERFHHEARRALQETPVVAIVDAGERQPGRRLPFDLLEVSDLVFHPKTALLLYRNFARLQIGSGNLTANGYGGNTELFLCVDLAYSDESDIALLAAFGQHLDRIHRLVRQTGTQFDLFRQELQRRIPAQIPPTRPSNIALLDSTIGPILDQLAALLPEDAVIQSIGMLAPFYERDDAEFDVTSVFGALAPRVGSDAILDVGLAWNNSQVHVSDASTIEDGLGRLWTWAYDFEDSRVVEHLVPMSIGPKTISYIDRAGQGRRIALDEVLKAIDQRTLWQQPKPETFAPRNTVSVASERFSKVRIWLHPATQIVDGRPVHRPLHAKLLIVGFLTPNSSGTLVLVGSPNMSRRALHMRAGKQLGNVEVALAFRLDSSPSLRDFLPELAFAPMSALDLKEREFPTLARNYALAIEAAIHDPSARSLTVTWSSEAAALPAWCLTYDDDRLASSNTAPTSPFTVIDFVLKPSTAEVVLHVGNREFSIPILVTDVIALPATPTGTGLGLHELLMLLGRRIGTEKALKIAARRETDNGDGNEMDTFFGEGFGPTDVFRAWWSVADNLIDPKISVQALRLRLEGALGADAAWSCMLDAIEQKSLSIEEVWFYGAELLRTLTDVDLPEAADREAKARLLDSFLERLRDDVGRLTFDGGNRPWLNHIFSFYGAPKP